MKLIIDISEKDLEFIKDLQFIGGLRCNTKTIQNNVINAIKKGKSYEERPQGEWITNGELDSKDVCSVCKKRFWYRCMTIDLNRIEDIWDFCPNCGADMRGVDEKDI